jgi:hypothetical protein
MSELPAIDHGSTRGSRWLRERRLKVALGLALLEGLLVAVDVISALLAIIVAAGVLALYFGWARNHGSTTLRETFWVLAVWQAIVLLVPVLVVVVGTLALVAVAAIAILALVALFADRG